MKAIFTVLLATHYCILAPSIHAASPRWSPLLATVDNLPPFSYIENGNLTGIDIDIITELARRAGFHITIATYPWARALLQLQHGLVDGAFSAYETEDRKEYCIYTGIIHYDELRLAVRKGKQFSYSNIESLYGKVIGKGKNVFVGNKFDQAVREGRIIVSETNDMDMSNIKKLHADRLDAVIGSPATLMHYAKKLGVEHDIVLLPTSLRERIPAYLVLSKSSPLEDKDELQQIIQAVLNEMRNDGTIRAINERYGHVVD